jgi:predicted transcriptional regulator
LYSPKVPEYLIPRLWRLAQDRHVPMTHLVRDAVVQYLKTEEGEERNGEEHKDRGTREGDYPDR